MRMDEIIWWGEIIYKRTPGHSNIWRSEEKEPAGEAEKKWIVRQEANQEHVASWKPSVDLNNQVKGYPE